MKTCLTCGAMVADNIEHCPDCGMELDATSPSVASPSSAPQASPAPSGSGFTVDFGFDSSPAATPPASGASSDASFEFGGGEKTVALDLNKEPSVPTPAPAPVVPVNSARITLKRSGIASSESFVFGPGAIVGRFDPDSGPVDVDLGTLPEASYVSRHHIEFRFDGGTASWYVRDLGSRNGTFWRAGGQGAFSRLNGEQLVQSGDEIALGNARFEFESL